MCCFVPFLNRNLVSGILLNNARLITVVGDDKVVIFSNEVFVRKGYLNESLFVLNVASKTLNGNSFSLAYFVESVDLRQGRLGHGNYAFIKWLKHMKLIYVVDVNNFSKCSICVDAKYAKIFSN